MQPEHVRHKPPVTLNRHRELVLACPQFRSSVNLSRIVRLAGCGGIPKIVACGKTRIDPKIARDAVESVEIVRRRTLPGALEKLRESGYQLVGLEQTTQSHGIFEYKFQRKSVLVIGHERHGLSDEILGLMHDCIEIPVYGQPHSYNVVTATTMAVYEYLRQFPNG